MNITDIIDGIGRPVSFYPSIAKLTGIKPCLLICQLLYWRARCSNKDGWIYKTTEELTDETGLTYNEQLSVRKFLVEHGILHERLDRLKNMLFFKIDCDALNEMWSTKTPLTIARNPEEARKAKLEKHQNGSMTQTRPGSIAQTPRSLSDRTGGSIAQTSVTTETTSENTITVANAPVDGDSGIEIKSPKPNPSHEFVEMWVKEYPKYHEGNAYILNKSNSGINYNHAKMLLDSSGLSPAQLIAIAINAWKFNAFWNAPSIQVFNSRINEIQTELVTTTRNQNQILLKNLRAKLTKMNEDVSADTSIKTQAFCDTRKNLRAEIAALEAKIQPK